MLPELCLGLSNMFIDRNQISEYPFTGVFYTSYVDMSKPLDERVEEEIVVLETKCDIQESQKTLSGTLTNVYEVYFPFDKESGIKIKNGLLFKSEMYGLVINGKVGGTFPSQMGGCGVYVTDSDV